MVKCHYDLNDLQALSDTDKYKTVVEMANSLAAATANS